MYITFTSSVDPAAIERSLSDELFSQFHHAAPSRPLRRTHALEARRIRGDDPGLYFLLSRRPRHSRLENLPEQNRLCRRFQHLRPGEMGRFRKALRHGPDGKRLWRRLDGLKRQFRL